MPTGLWARAMNRHETGLAPSASGYNSKGARSFSCPNQGSVVREPLTVPPARLPLWPPRLLRLDLTL